MATRVRIGPDTPIAVFRGDKWEKELFGFFYAVNVA